MIYEEFAPKSQASSFRADWAGEWRHLRNSALDVMGWALAVLGYCWLFARLFLIHPYFHWDPLLLPATVGATGLFVLLAGNTHHIRGIVFACCTLLVGSVAIFFERSFVAPIFFLIAICTVTVAARPSSAFAMATAASGILMFAASKLPGVWPTSVIQACLASYWFAATAAWLTSRDLHTVLTWALTAYESGWQRMRELEQERGKLNQIMKDLANANGLLKRTTHDLAEAREEAERARQLKSQFAANISHELRTPLHLIIGFSQIMYTSPESYEGVEWSTDLRADIQEIYESAQHLLHLIDDVLDLSQIDAARLPISKEAVMLVPLIEEAADTARSLLRGRNIYLQLDLPASLPVVYADPTRIRQVLLNLLNNASRFTEKGGITVKATAHSDTVEIIVQDTGPGIPAEQLSAIFSEFHQIDNSLRRRYGGTGLGLAICKQFVSLHDGRIWAESHLGVGSAFHFTLPLPNNGIVQRQMSRLPAGWRYPAAKPQTRRLVTMGSPPEFTRLIARHLSNTEVLEATSMQELVALVRQCKADAVIVTPGSGVDEERLAQSTSDIFLPVITCSLPLERHLALAEGFDYCLMKPFTVQGLLGALAEVAPNARKVLAVDDDPGVVRLVERSLHGSIRGMEVLAAYDGLEAISMLEQHPDVVLLDLILPKANGLEVLHAIRNGPARHKIPVVATTAYGFARDVAALGQGQVVVRRGQHFSAAEITHWLDTVLQTMPARYLDPGAPESALAPEPTGLPVSPGMRPRR